eukprot:TRINITY_DN7185_c0_g1_i1.p1 TRINITY_DN7185_c0_g1~~TRINITY_DN7185_c0_g1_i1.p1  ORF type:complete len:267 (-),score=10.63 TRINITY_DN7185_c0_g1_i1:211-1011(-)
MFFIVLVIVGFFFFQAEDGIRDVERSRGLGDVYKRQYQRRVHGGDGTILWASKYFTHGPIPPIISFAMGTLSYLCYFQIEDCEAVLKSSLNLEESLFKAPVPTRLIVKPRLRCTCENPKIKHGYCERHGEKCCCPERYLEGIQAINDITLDRVYLVQFHRVHLLLQFVLTPISTTSSLPPFKEMGNSLLYLLQSDYFYTSRVHSLQYGCRRIVSAFSSSCGSVDPDISILFVIPTITFSRGRENIIYSRARGEIHSPSERGWTYSL